MSSSKKTLFLGIGNPILSDDSIGHRLADEVKTSGLFPNAVFEKVSVGGLEILEIVVGYERVIFFDAIRSGKGKPGDVYFFKEEDFRETLNLSNLHDISFLTAFELGRKLELQVPKEMHIVAVEILEDKEFSAELTEPLKKRYPEIVREVLEFVKSLK